MNAKCSLARSMPDRWGIAYRAEDREQPLAIGCCQRTYVRTDILLCGVMQ